MTGLPDFISPTTKRSHLRPLESDEAGGYQPLLAAWVIEVMLLTGNHKKIATRDRYLIDEESEIGRLAGLSIVRDGDSDLSDATSMLLINGKQVRRTSVAIARELTRIASEFRRLPVRDGVNVFENVGLLGKVLGLSRAEQAVLCFAAFLEVIPLFECAIGELSVRVPFRRVATIIARLTGNIEGEVMAALKPDATLYSSGIIETNHRNTGSLEGALQLLPGLGMLLSQPYQSSEALISRFLKKAAGASLSLRHYPHLQRDTAVLADYLRAALAQREHGTNVLLHGIPGTGKSEFVKALAAELGVDLYEISFADNDGDPITGMARLRAYNLCQRILAGRDNALLMFDEIEDVLPSKEVWHSLFSDGKGDAGTTTGKAWVNRSLEQNQTPAIWITNNARIDNAYLRRFDYSVKFSIPPHQVRKEIARHHLGRFNPPEEWLAIIAANELLTPAQYDRAAKVARLGSQGESVRALQLVEQTLERSAMLLGQRAAPRQNVPNTAYDLRFANTSMQIGQILDGLSKRRNGTFCFYGPAGTGKSEFARHIADRLGVPCIVRRASDILSRWLGGTEQNIAEMFAEARQQQAVLVLDEADSFLADRRDAQRSWEVTQVNELLTQMEAFDGIFVCTTNLIDRLDQASLRRFAFKVKFDYLDPDQRWQMFLQELHRLGGDLSVGAALEGEVRRLEKLTPGDFAVAAKQFSICGDPATGEGLFARIKEECRMKAGSLGRIGF